MSLTHMGESKLILERVLSFFRDDRFQPFMNEAIKQNPWFTEEGILLAAKAWEEALDVQKVHKWLSQYRFAPANQDLEVVLILAGNIPWVGLHDILCGLVSGVKLRIKPSSKDTILIKALLEDLFLLFPHLKEAHHIDSKIASLTQPAAIIATGADNSIQDIRLSFPNIPHLFRGNRQSLAILTGKESDKELLKLLTDISSYHGLGCRNVSLIFVPHIDSIVQLVTLAKDKSWKNYHAGYLHAIKQQKAILSINKTPFYGIPELLFVESSQLASPMGVVHYQHYNSLEDSIQYIKNQAAHIQCVVGSLDVFPDAVRLGQAQHPELWDYADQIDTLNFLNGLIA